MNGAVLHVFKLSNSQAIHHYLGSTKDIRSRTEYLNSRGIPYEEVLPIGKEVYRDHLENNAPQLNWKSFQAVLLEMTFSPDAIKFVRNKAPQAIIAIRSHNAELFHRVHWACGSGILSTNGRNMLRLAVRGLRQDYACAKHSDFILSISKWETDNYWNRIANSRKIKTVPFFLPESYVQRLSQSTTKKNLCLQFGSSIKNYLAADSITKFLSAVNNLKHKAMDWEFCITGEKQDNVQNINMDDSRVRYLGLLNDPYTILLQARAVAHLSHLGFGFKTKLLEAIMAKAYILLPWKLYNRLPVELHPYCIAIDPQSPESFECALEICKKDYPIGNPNNIFRQQAFEALDSVFLK